MKYAVLDSNMDRLKKKLAAIETKCRRYGCEFHFEEAGDEFRELIDEAGKPYMARFILVEADGIAKVNGWRYVGRIQHEETGNVIQCARVGEAVPERYYHCEPVCEHCGTKRSRNETYLVVNDETGEWKQVGKSCLNDFTHGMSADYIAQYISWFDTLIEGEKPDPHGAYRPYYEMRTVLQYFVETIRKFGYVKSNQEEISTATRGSSYFFLKEAGMDSKMSQALENEMAKVNFDAHSDVVVRETDAALAWLGEQDSARLYIHNLQTVCGMKYIRSSYFTLLASLYATYRKDCEYAQKQANGLSGVADSQYVGQIGQRIQFNTDEAQCVYSYDTQFGTSHLYRMIDRAGNVLMWRTGVSVPDGKLTVSGTVKKHSVYRGVKQTELTRCKIVSA